MESAALEEAGTAAMREEVHAAAVPVGARAASPANAAAGERSEDGLEAPAHEESATQSVR